MPWRVNNISFIFEYISSYNVAQLLEFWHDSDLNREKSEITDSQINFKGIVNFLKIESRWP